MTKIKERGILSIEDAMDNLSAIVAIDLENPPRLGIIRGSKLVTDGMEIGSLEVLWLSEEGSEEILEILDQTYDAICRHFELQLENPNVDWKSPKIKKGMASMATLAGEAAQIIDEYFALKTGKPVAHKTINRPSYKQLQHLYWHRLEKKILETSDDPWIDPQELMPGQPESASIKDFEAVRNDLDYELFLIRNENGEPYFHPKMLRNVKLACDFSMEKEGDFEDDPLLRIRSMQDRDLHASAQQILIECKFEIQGLCRIRKEIASSVLMNLLMQAVMALYLAADSRHLIQNSSGKCCLQYFNDFHQFLRLALKSPEYQKMIAYPEEANDPAMKNLLELANLLCQSLFDRLGGIKQETIALLHRYMRKGEEKAKKKSAKGDTIYNQMLIDDEKFRSLLSRYPNGPLFKILDLIREENPETLAFDPLMQGNLPQKICNIEGKGLKLSVLHCACPTRQMQINQIELAAEFGGFLRSYAEDKKPKKHLLINLQDRTSWKESTRSQVLEQLQTHAEFHGSLVVVTLPKGTDFYCQNNEYLEMGGASEFIEQFKSQIASAGFFFPRQCFEREIEEFSNRSLALIHEAFFDSKSNLSRQNREDFIEIFYQMLVLKLIEIFKPASISFTCKDGIDTGAASAASFLGWIALFSGDFSKRVDFLRWVLYAPALMIRERCVSAERLTRALSLWETVGFAIEEKSAKILKTIGGLYPAGWLQSIHFQ